MNEQINAQLPFADIVQQGITDLRAGRLTAAAYIVAAARVPLREAGVRVPEPPAFEGLPEHGLYTKLHETMDVFDAHSRYNAYMQGVVSFINAAHVTGEPYQPNSAP